MLLLLILLLIIKMLDLFVWWFAILIIFSTLASYWFHTMSLSRKALNFLQFARKFPENGLKLEIRRNITSRNTKVSNPWVKYVSIVTACGIGYSAFIAYRNKGTVYAFKMKKVSVTCCMINYFIWLYYPSIDPEIGDITCLPSFPLLFYVTQINVM